MGTNTTKPYKIQESNGVRRVGITAGNLQDLKKKALEQLNISEDFQPYLDDGTAVLTEEYFKTLDAQTCFTFAPPGKENLKMDFLKLQMLTQRISKKLAEGQDTLTEQVKQFLTGDNAEVVNRALLDYISSLQSNIDLETREEDANWFDGLHEKYQTKEAVMKDGAKTRIRNYYQKTREYMSELETSHEDVLSTLDILREELRLNDYNGQYFVRSANKDVRICDKLGWFKCEGKFNEKVCLQSHSINPYGSKEARIVFSTWNLDHVIEKSREILPTFAKVAEKCPKSSEVNWQYFYDLLFTKKNLKLVHIACHVKGIHTGKKCDKKQFYKSKSNKKKVASVRRSKRSKKWTFRRRDQRHSEMV